MKAVAVFLLVLCYLAVSHAWTCKEAPSLNGALQVDAGQGKVVAIDKNYYVYFLSGKNWYRLGTYRFRHVSVGPAGIWGADTSNRVYKFVAGNFQLAKSNMQQVDAGGDGQVVGVYSSRVYCLRSTYASAFTGSGSLSWTLLGGLTYLSCSPQHGCWGVGTSYQIYYTQRMTPTSCSISGWVQVSGSAKMVEVGTDGNVFMVGADGNVYQRVGISSSHPYGTSWSRVVMCVTIRHLSYDLGNLWVVTNGGNIMQCTN